MELIAENTAKHVKRFVRDRFLKGVCLCLGGGLLLASPATAQIFDWHNMSTDSDVIGLPLLGDFDANGTVAFSDFLVVSANFNTAVGSYVLGDTNGDGLVDFSDFLVVSTNFNKSSGAATSAVPEPSGIAIAVVMGIGLLGLRRGRQRFL